jgi:lysophospholipase L1-like esterase
MSVIASGGGFRRFVAVGDSTTQGIDDPRAAGGYRGWADRLAERLSEGDPELLYANLAVRGKLMRQIRAEQLGPALDLAPDLVTVVGGFNDLLRRRYDPHGVAADLEAMLVALRATGATVVTMTLPDLSAFIPAARLVRARMRAYDEATRRAAERSGAVVVDLARTPGAADPRFWSDDRLHANTAGHAYIAAAFAQALGVAGADGDAALEPVTRRRGRAAAMAAEAVWLRRHMVPWIGRRMRGRSSGDGARAKRPELAPVRR